MDECVVFLFEILAAHLRTKAHGDIALLEALGNDLLDADECAADDEEDVFCVDLDGRRLGVLALAARRELDDTALKHLEKRLLDALVTGVSGDGIVRAGFACDLVEFVEVDDAVLCLFDVFVRRIVEVADGDLDIRADEARLGETGGIRYGKRHVEELREMGEESGLATARGAEHDDVRLLDLRALVLFLFVAVFHALVVVVDGDGEDFLRAILIDDVGVEILLDEVRARLFQHVTQLLAKRRALLRGDGCVVLVEVAVDLTHAVLADRKARVRIVDRHIVLVAHVDDALAERALMLDRIFRHEVFLSIETM